MNGHSFRALSGALGALWCAGCGASSPLLGGGGGSDAGMSPDAGMRPDAGMSPDAGYRVEAIPSQCDDLDRLERSVLISAMGDDVTTNAVPLPEPFVFFGVSRAAFSVSTNGFLQLFTTLAAAAPQPGVAPNAPAPSEQLPPGIIAPMYDDLEVSAGAEVRVGAEPGRDPYRVFEWRSVGFCCGAIDRASLTFQAKLFASGAIEFHYCRLEASAAQRDRAAGSNAFVGVQDSTTTRGVTVAFQRPGSLSTRTGYRLTPVR